MTIELQSLPIDERLYRHAKTGGLYQIICYAAMERNTVPYVVYRSIDTGMTWIRPKSEFFDGRFELVKEKEENQEESTIAG